MMNSPAHEFSGKSDEAAKVSELFIEALKIEELELSNEFKARRERQRQLEDKALTIRLAEAEESFNTAMFNGSSTRYIPSGASIPTSINRSRRSRFHISPDKRRLTAMRFGYLTDEDTKSVAALILQTATGTDIYGAPFDADSLCVVSKHARMGFMLNPNFSITRISDPANRSNMIVLNNGTVHDDKYKQGLQEIQGTIHSLLLLHQSRAERETTIAQQSQSIGETILPKLASVPDVLHQPPHA